MGGVQLNGKFGVYVDTEAPCIYVEGHNMFAEGTCDRGTFIKRGGGTIDSTNRVKYGKVAYSASDDDDKYRDDAADPLVNLDSRRSSGWKKRKW
jgi:hypothetical protein